VAPDTELIFALWAVSVDALRTGTARWLIESLLPPVGVCRVVTLVIVPPATVICTSTGPHLFVDVAPTNVPSANAVDAACDVAAVVTVADAAVDAVVVDAVVDAVVAD